MKKHTNATKGRGSRKPKTVGGLAIDGLHVEARPFTQSRLVTDPEARRMLVTALRAGASVQAAAAAAGISRSSVYRTLLQGRQDLDGGVWGPHAEVAAEILQARGEAHVGLVAIVRRAAQAGEWKAAAWLLDRLDRGSRLPTAQDDLLADDTPTPAQGIRFEIEVVECRKLTKEEFLQGIRDPTREVVATLA